MEIFSTIVPASTVVHVLAVVIGMGAALSADLLFHFFSKDKHFSFVELRTLGILSKTVWYSIIIIIVSGIFLFLSDTEKYLDSSKFLAKMTIMGILLINGDLKWTNKFGFHYLFKGHTEAWLEQNPEYNGRIIIKK